MNIKEYFENDIECEKCKFAEFCKKYLLGSHPSACDYDAFCSSIKEEDMIKDVDSYYNEVLQIQLSYNLRMEQQREKEKQKQKAIEIKRQKRQEYYYKNRYKILEHQRQKRQEIRKQKALESIESFSRALSRFEKIIND